MSSTPMPDPRLCHLPRHTNLTCNGFRHERWAHSTAQALELDHKQKNPEYSGKGLLCNLVRM